MKKQILTLSAAAFMAALTCQTAFALDHDVVILHTNDTHCGIEENMGYAGLVWYENQMKEETPYVTWWMPGTPSRARRWGPCPRASTWCRS